MPETLTIVERQILANQFRILAQIEENGEHHSISAEILERGLTGQYHSVFNVYNEEKSIEICNETSEILNMYRRINNTIAGLSEAERDELDLERIQFDGFDANNDPHYHYMTFLVENMNLWQEHSGNYLNSHTQASLAKYRRMLDYQNQLDNPNNIGIEDLRNYINAL
ncbi:uncharacterized protein YfbU (UPF0304 family) [Winogradskyella pacifica]|uniref:Uncharacterized protein YfbU (UPF0304 family) n=1 Tax=Winogradskyella pacifica TaxID=664642 RepID=A0A3D9LKB0_9FLAO|nr:YfbU family protein [Winogradskyella pacifica]REE07808.1 uncharacterized protein YfbU (UPF0304 family) [Winogradskyella pacifica]